MKNRLVIILFLLTHIIGFSQYCPYLGPNQLLPCGVTSTTLTADLSQCGVGGNNPNQTTNYGVTNIPYVTQTNTGTQLFMSDDSQQGPFQIGFNFCFFGQTYNQFWVGSNGWISFSAGQPTTFTSTPIPSVLGNIPKNCIMGPWQDWHPGVGGQIRYQVQGVSPCRKLIVSWINMPMFNCTQTLGTFHIVIYESTNVIENHIQSKQFCNWANGTAVQGIHNLAGTIGITVPGRNSTQWTTTNNAYRWTPSGPTVTPTLTWYQVGNPNPIGTGPTITVNPPPQGANYTCHFVYPSCNTGWNVCNQQQGGLGPDTVFVQPGPPNLSPPSVLITDPTCDGYCDGEILITPSSGTSPFTISWNTLNGFNPTGLCQGNYTYTLTDNLGCDYSGFVNLFSPPPVVINPITGSDTICYNSIGNLFSTSNVIPNLIYNWSNTNGIINGQGTSQILLDVNGVNSGYYSNMISVYGVDVNGCNSQTETFNVEILNIFPVITPIGPFCSYDEFVTLQATPIGGIFIGNGVIGNNFYPNSSIGIDTITYSYIQSGCLFDTLTTTTVYPQPILDSITPYNPFYEICEGDSVNILFNAISNLPGYNIWSLSNVDYQVDVLTTSFNNEGTYILSVVHYSNGCISNEQQSTITIQSCPEELVYIPNSFTPDNDELNQRWKPIFSDGFDPYDFNLTVINRWGQIIWESFNPGASWDGTYNGEYCQDGVYIWKVEFGNTKNDGKKTMIGHLTIIR